MGDFTISEMLAMQRQLQERYQGKWETICPEAGKHKLLWMIGEIGEVIDIIKKTVIGRPSRRAICGSILWKKWPTC